MDVKVLSVPGAPLFSGKFSRPKKRTLTRIQDLVAAGLYYDAGMPDSMTIDY